MFFWRKKEKPIYKCLICGGTRESVGPLVKAYIRAYSKGGTKYFPLCRPCYSKFDKQKVALAELKKLGIREEVYAYFKLKRSANKNDTLRIELEKMLRESGKEQ